MSMEQKFVHELGSHASHTVGLLTSEYGDIKTSLFVIAARAKTRQGMLLITDVPDELRSTLLNDCNQM